MDGGIGPVDCPCGMAVFYGTGPAVMQVNVVVAAIADGMFPKPTLPDTGIAFFDFRGRE